jgi:hypothetical protein
MDESEYSMHMGYDNYIDEGAPLSLIEHFSGIYLKLLMLYC